MIKEIKVIEGEPQTIEEKLEVLKDKINEVIRHVNKNLEG